MKRKTAFVILFFVTIDLLPSLIKAQTFQWVNHQTHSIPFNPEITSFTSESDVQGNSLISTIHNFKLSFSGYYGDIALKKYSSSGVIIFNKIMYGKINSDYLQTDASGNIYLCGTFMDTLRIDSVNNILNTGSGFNTNYFIIKLTPNGDFVWKKNINSEFSSNLRLDAIKIMENNLYVSLLNGFQGFLKKLDLNGNEQMSISQSGIAKMSSIDVDRLGNIYSGGACGNGSVTFGDLTLTAPYPYNVYIVKYNSSGNCQWAKFVQDITFQSIDVACDNSGNLFAAGDLFGSFMFGKIQAQGNQWVYDFFLTKLDQNGNFLWVKEVPNTPTITGDAGAGKVNSIAVDQQNNVYLSGFLRGSVNWGNNVVTASSGYMDILLLKYDQNGNILFGKKAGGVGSNRSDDISLDNSGNVFLSGNFSSTALFDSITAAGTGNINSYLVKMRSSLFAGNIDLKIIIEGFYDRPGDSMRLGDTVRLYLRNSKLPFLIIDSSFSVISENTFTGSFPFYNAASGNYYLQTGHRNSLETWSKNPVSYVQGGSMNYDFTTSADKAFGNNVRQINDSPLRFAIYSGDVNREGNVDLADIILVYNNASEFVTGYVNTDISGDNFTDLTDIIIVNNNSNKFVSVMRP